VRVSSVFDGKAAGAVRNQRGTEHKTAGVERGQVGVTADKRSRGHTRNDPDRHAQDDGVERLHLRSAPDRGHRRVPTFHRQPGVPGSHGLDGHDHEASPFASSRLPVATTLMKASSTGLFARATRLDEMAAPADAVVMSASEMLAIAHNAIRDRFTLASSARRAGLPARRAWQSPL